MTTEELPTARRSPGPRPSAATARPARTNARSGLSRADQLHAGAVADLEAGRPARAERRFVAVLDALDALDALEPLGPVDPMAAVDRLGPVAVGPLAHGRTPADLRVVTLLGLSAARADLRTVNDGLAVLVDAAEVVDRTGNPDLRALVDMQHGWLLFSAGRPRDALAHFNAAAVRMNRLTPHNQCSVLNGRAFAYSDLHQIRAARADWAECVARAASAGLSIMQFKGLCNLAWADYLAGDLPGALATMAEAAEMDADVERGILTMDRARVLIDAGLLDEADRALAAAGAEFARLRLGQEQAEAELARADCALVAAEDERAARFARRAARRFRRRGNDAWARVAELTELQAVARMRTRGLSGSALALREEFTRAGQHAQARSAGALAAELLLADGRVADARDLLAHDRTRPSDRIGQRLQGRVAATTLALTEGDQAAARRIIRRGVAELAAHQATFGSLDLRTASAVHGRRLAALDVRLALVDGRADVVFDAVERARAVSSRLPAVRPPEDARTAALLAELRAIIELTRAGTGDAPASLLRRQRVIQEQISARAWARSPELRVSEPARAVAAREVRRRLAERGAELVAFARTAESVTAVVLGAGASRMVDLGRPDRVRELINRIRADLDALAGRGLPAALRATVSSSLRTDLRALDDVVVRPLGLGSKRLIMVAGGAVATVPWGNLPSLSGVPTVVAPSATWWARTQDRIAVGPPPGRRRVIALAGPDLGRSAREARDVAALWPDGQAVVEGAATTEALSHALATADLVHVAAHGRHEPQNPLFSSVRLADGRLFAHELGRGARTAEHVVLSACDVGLATVRPGDEALGLTSALLHQGTLTVVAGVCRIGDEVAHDAMIGYHRCLAAGTEPADAVASMVAASPQAAPFVCFGVG